MRNVTASLFEGAVWGQEQNAGFRVPSSAEAQDKVLTALLEAPLTPQRRNPLEWAASFLIHAIVLAAFLIAPLFFTQVIDLRNLQVTYLVAPAPPPAPSPPLPIRAAVQNTRPVKVARILPRLVAPSTVPRTVAVVHEPDAPPGTNWSYRRSAGWRSRRSFERDYRRDSDSCSAGTFCHHAC